ncbi:MAG TPA: DUF2795 domain-containing protein [Thermodesulfobacteriota bacterium]
MPVNPVQVQKFLSGVDYPAENTRLLETARQHGADRAVLDGDRQAVPRPEVLSGRATAAARPCRTSPSHASSGRRAPASA